MAINYKFNQDELDFLKELGLREVTEIEESLFLYDEETIDSVIYQTHSENEIQQLKDEYYYLLESYGLRYPEDGTVQEKELFATRAELVFKGIKLALENKLAYLDIIKTKSDEEIKALPDAEEILRLKETLMHAQDVEVSYKSNHELSETQVEDCLEVYNNVFNGSDSIELENINYNVILDAIFVPEESLDDVQVKIKTFIEEKIGVYDDTVKNNNTTNVEYINKLVFLATALIDKKNGKNNIDSYKDYFANGLRDEITEDIMGNISTINSLRDSYIENEYQLDSTDYLDTGIEYYRHHSVVDYDFYRMIVTTPLSELETMEMPDNIKEMAISMKKKIIVQNPEPVDGDYETYAQSVLNDEDYNDIKIGRNQFTVDGKFADGDMELLTDALDNLKNRKENCDNLIEIYQNRIDLIDKVLDEGYELSEDDKRELGILDESIDDELLASKKADYTTCLNEVKKTQQELIQKIGTCNLAQSVISSRTQKKDEGLVSKIKKSAKKAKEKVSSLKDAKPVNIVKKGVFNFKNWISEKIIPKVKSKLSELKDVKNIAALIVGGTVGVGVSLAFGATGVAVMTVGATVAKVMINKSIQKIEMKRLNGEEQLVAIEVPSEGLKSKILNSKVGQFFNSEEGLKAINWALTGAIIGGTTTQIIKSVNAANIAKQQTIETNTQNFGNANVSTPESSMPDVSTPESSLPSVSTPEVLENSVVDNAATQAPNILENSAGLDISNIKLGSNVGEFNVAHGYDTANWAVNGINQENLISSIVTPDSVFKRFAIVNPDGSIAQIVNGAGKSIAEIASQYGVDVSNIAVDIANAQGQSQAWTTAAELMETIGKGL